MRVLVWHWGKRGAGPRVAVDLARGLEALPGVGVTLSLSRQAEILASRDAPEGAVTVGTYRSLAGLILRLAGAPLLLARLTRRLRRDPPDLAICAMPSALDAAFVLALRRAGVPIVSIIHDAVPHPGDGNPFLKAFQRLLQRLLIADSRLLVTFSRHVADALAEDRIAREKPILALSHPPFIAAGAPAPFRHGGPPRLLMFGRLLPYKGLDLLAAALPLVAAPYECRVVGKGPPSRYLDALAVLPGVHVENRWVPEDELPALVAWADVLLLPYREASQSGVGAMAIAGGRYVVATRVGGLAEQFADDPQAVLCAPEEAAIAAGISSLLRAPPPVRIARDGKGEWRALASEILAAGIPPAGPLKANPA